MKKNDIKDFLEKEISIYVRYGFKKQTEETQSYSGILKYVNDLGIILERKIGENLDIKANDFFPWHNIDAIRYIEKNI